MAACSDRPVNTPPAGCRSLTDPEPDSAPAPPFGSAEGLRTLLDRLHLAGPDAWRQDREVEALMRFAADRYAALARKYDQHPGDAAAAAFEAMRAEATRTADDPWAVITVAVRRTLAAEHRANGLLTSASRARRSAHTDHHDAERFSDRSAELPDHPALQHHDIFIGDEGVDGDADIWVLDIAADVLVVGGWSRAVALAAVTHICAHLADIGHRTAAYEALRRDKAIRAQLDLSHSCWIGLLRATLGHPTAPGPAGHGLIARLLADEPATLLTGDCQLMALIATDHVQSAAVTR